MKTPPQKRLSPSTKGSQKSEDRTDQAKRVISKEHVRNHETTTTSSSSAGAKRAATELDHEDKAPNQATDTRAIYDANKAEIDEWYDRDYSCKQGIQPHGKLLRSNHRWYQKVAAWMKFKGMCPSPKKKRKLNDSTPVSDEVQETRPLRPHQIRYPDDLVSVPEYPLDRLGDYTRMDNGRYACSHVHLEPPRECCEIGLHREAKRQSIKKSVLRWKGKVEKLIDRKQLDQRHMTWPDWTVPALRKKHQRALWEKQEAKRQADSKKRKEEESQRAETKEQMGGSSVQPSAHVQVAHRHPANQRSTSVTIPTSGPPRPPAPTTLGSASTTAAFVDQPRRTMRRQSHSDAIASTQNAFLNDLARTNPPQLRLLDALYHDAQYRENLKEHPDFARLKEWYRAYFLAQKRQPLSAKQRTLLDSGDPSYHGKKKIGSMPALATVERLFSEYSQAARAEKVAQQTQQQLKTRLEQQASSPTFSLVSQPLTLQPVRTESPAQVDAHYLNTLYEDAVLALTTASDTRSASHTAFEVLDYETLDSELDRILANGPAYRTQPAVSATEPLPQDATALRTETSYVTTLPETFATGNQTVDDEMREMLEYAYQTETTSQEFISEDEQLLRQTIEDGWPDWQRYCDFFDDEHLFNGI